MSNYANMLIIVESPAKAKTISQYLKSSNVIASYGHIRKLVGKSGSVMPDQDFRMIWEDTPTSPKHVANIVKKAKEIQKQNGKILIATDLDREGQGIAQHIFNLLQENKINVPIRRVILEEITKKKILEAIEDPTDINQNEVDAYFGRICMDYLIGFHLSPILWRKAKGCRSAGRVQSAVLRAIIEREFEIIKFNPEKYWTLTAMIKIAKRKYEAELYEFHGKLVEKFMWNAESVQEAKNSLLEDKYAISLIEEKPSVKAPNPPFTTSTLHQEASTKLGWKSSKTAKIAQSLYEGVSVNGSIMGLVTYIRTDSVRMSDEATHACVGLIKDNYGDKYAKLRQYKNKSDSVQDAHEAIRPTNFSMTPWSINITPDEGKLYDLIWRRAVASQMAEAQYNITNVFVAGEVGKWKIHGREQKFDGFLKVYEEEKDTVNDLKDIKQTDSTKCDSIEVKEHQTQPKPRYSEASLIKHMDTVGIGRPSTYSATIDVLENRGYIERSSKKIVPLPSAWIVTGFLNNCCPQYIRDDFTASVEDDLDLISEGKLNWKEFLRKFWNEFTPVLNKMSMVESQAVLKKIGESYPEYFFSKEESKECPKCGVGAKILCTSKDGVFIGCSNYPNCELTININKEEPNIVGIDPESGEDITLKEGKYGHYLEWKNAKKYVSVPANMVKSMSLEMAMKLKSLPIELGNHPETGNPIKVGIGRYGPYVLYSGVYVSSRSIDINLAQALDLISKSSKFKKKD